MDGQTTKFEWVFTEKVEEFFYYAIRFEDDVLNVLSYDGTEVLLEINHYYWFFEINDSYLSINQ